MKFIDNIFSAHNYNPPVSLIASIVVVAVCIASLVIAMLVAYPIPIVLIIMISAFVRIVYAGFTGK
jgi:hypothetical protein